MDLPPLPDTTILLVEVGSTAHGTGIPGGEDYDQLGVVVEMPDQVLGLDDGGFTTVMQRTQPEGVRSGPGDVDRTLHSLRRFVRLAASGNPSILMALWAPIDHATPEGKELQALGEAFIGRHVVPRYRGYMQSQAQRLLGTRGGGHGRRGGGGREELVEAHGYDTKYAMHCARLGFQCQELLTTGQLQLPVQGEPANGCAPSDEVTSASTSGGPPSCASTLSSPRSSSTSGSGRARTRHGSSDGRSPHTSASGGNWQGPRAHDEGGRRAAARAPHSRRHRVGGRGAGHVLVDAAAQALVEGLNSPTLRILAGAPRAAADLVAGHGTPSEVTATLNRMDVASGFADELADFSGFDDCYHMLRGGIISGSVGAVDEAVMQSARSLAAGEPRVGFDVSGPFLSSSEE